jgi:hypothetical protein
MKKLFTMQRAEPRSIAPEPVPAGRNDDDPTIITLGRISDLTQGTLRPRTDDPNKWGDKEQ